MNKTTPKDFFLHVGATIALYVSVIALINLTFEIVNRFLPDQLDGYFSANALIYPISILVVLVPVLYVIEWCILRDTARMLEKKDIWVRKWRIYLTLFLTGATMAGDVVALINTYLNGDISGRFIAKVLIVLLIAGTVFKYYFFSINEQMKWANREKKVLPYVGIIIVLAMIIGGFIIVGSPAQQRALRFDEQRISDLTGIQWQIINYWQKKHTLPVVLSDLNDPIVNFVVPADPETATPYTYHSGCNVGSDTKGSVNNAGGTCSLAATFELCATFSTASDQTMRSRSRVIYPVAPNPSQTMEAWDHPQGNTCFSRTIDPALYPQVK